MTVFTKTGQQIFAPVDENGDARSVVNQEVQVWSTEVERQVKFYAFDTRAVAEATSIPESITSIRLEGRSATGDGRGGLFIDTDNGSTRTFESADGRMWYLAADVGIERLATSVRDPIDRPFYKNLFKKRPILNVAMAPPSYAAALAILAGEDPSVTYIYASDFAFNRERNRLMILTSPKGGTGRNWVAVYDLTTGTFISSFFGGAGYSKIVSQESGGVHTVSIRGAGGLRLDYDITNLPADLASPSPIASNNKDIYSLFDFRNGDWFYQVLETPESTKRITSRFYRETAAGTRLNGVKFRIDQVGDNNALSAYFPHLQGIALTDNGIVASFGTVYTTGTATQSQLQGTRIFTKDGGDVAEALYDPALARTILANAGYANTRIENEGIHVDENGDIFSLTVLLDATDPSASTGGYLICQENVQGDATDGVLDFLPAAVSCSAPQLSRYLPVYAFRKHASNTFFNEVTGAQFTTLDQMLDFMVDAEIKYAVFFSGSVALTDVDGTALLANADFTIRNDANSSFFVSVRSNTTHQEWLINASGPRVKTVLFERWRRTGSPAGSISALTVGAQCHDLSTGRLWLATAIGTSGWVPQPRYLSGSKTYDAPSIPAYTTNGSNITSTTVTVPGAALGMMAKASFGVSTVGLMISASVTAADTVSVIMLNATAAPIDLGSTTLTAWALS